MPPYTVPPVFDLLIYAGDSFTMAATVTQGGAPFNLTGYSAAAQIRATPAATTTLAAMAATIAGNVITLTLTPAQTGALPSGAAVWDLRITSGGGAVTTLLAGAAKVTGSVTPYNAISPPGTVGGPPLTSGDYYDITAYGATAASPDNKAAIDAAIAAAGLGGGVVYFPAGTWATTGSHEIPLNVSVLGAGKGLTVINHKGIGTYCLYVGSPSGGPAAPTYLGKVSDFTISGQSAGNGTGSFGQQIGIEIQNCLFFNIQDVHAVLLWKAYLIDGGDEVALGAGTFAGNGFVKNVTCSNVYFGFHIYRWVTDTTFDFIYGYGNGPIATGSIGLNIDGKASTCTFVNPSFEGWDTGYRVATVNQGCTFVNPRVEGCNTYVAQGANAWGHLVLGGNLADNPSAPPWPTGSAAGANTIIARDGYFQQAPVGGLPPAAAGYRHSIYRIDGGAGVADGIYVCTKSATDTYAWHEITL